MTVSPDADVRVELRFKNARLYHAIQEASYKDKDYRNSFARRFVGASSSFLWLGFFCCSFCSFSCRRDMAF